MDEIYEYSEEEQKKIFQISYQATSTPRPADEVILKELAESNPGTKGWKRISKWEIFSHGERAFFKHE